MLPYYFSLLFFITTHLPLISIPTCHITLEQNQQNPHTTIPHKKPLFYNHAYEQTDKLLGYSSTQLKEYFDYHSYSEKEILSQNTLYLSDAFVELAKTYPSYEKTITRLHKKIQRMWIVQKAANYIIHGSSYSQFLKRLNHLYNELRSYKQIATENAVSFAQLYDIHLLTLFPHNDSLVAKNIYKNYVAILERAYHIPLHNSVLRDCIGQASRIGLEANKNGYTKHANQLADFCLTIIDYTAACGEGIYLGATHAVQAITHPVETVKNGLLGIGIIAHGLSKLVTVPIECTFLYATDKDRFYIQKNNMLNQLEMIINTVTHYVKTTPTRELVKQSSAFITEGMVFTKICSLAHTMSKQLLSIAHNYFEYVAKNEPAACLANGTMIEVNLPKTLHIPHVTESKIAQQLHPLGKGSTGRSTPTNLYEKLVMEEALSNPSRGRPLPLNKGMTDHRWHQDDGWIKMYWRNHDVEVHYVVQKKNGTIIAVDDFKFKDYQRNL